jgi:hypothetical protein
MNRLPLELRRLISEYDNTYYNHYKLYVIPHLKLAIKSLQVFGHLSRNEGREYNLLNVLAILTIHDNKFYYNSVKCIKKENCKTELKYLVYTEFLNRLPRHPMYLLQM